MRQLVLLAALFGALLPMAALSNVAPMLDSDLAGIQVGPVVPQKS